MKNKCDLLILFYYNQTKHTAGTRAKIKGNEAGTEIKLHTMNSFITEIYMHFYPKKCHFLPAVWDPCRSDRISKLKNVDQNRKLSLDGENLISM